MEPGGQQVFIIKKIDRVQHRKLIVECVCRSNTQYYRSSREMKLSRKQDVRTSGDSGGSE